MHQLRKSILIVLVITFCFLIISCETTNNDLRKLQLSSIKGAVNPEFSTITEDDQTYDVNFTRSYQKFVGISTQAIITPTDQNQVISPMSYYMSLAMLSEATNDKCFSEIIKALDMESLDYIRENSKKLFENHYDVQDSNTKVLMGNSLWIDDGFTVKEELLENLATIYYALSYHGDLQSLKTAEKIKQWVSQMTGNLINAKAEDYKAKDLVVLSLLSTIYLQSPWKHALETFGEKNFRTGEGNTIQTHFMYAGAESVAYLTDSFSAYLRDCINGYHMYFILPNKNLTPFDLINDSRIMDQIININKVSEEINVKGADAYIPKFGFHYKTNLIEPSKTLGIHEIFNTSNQGFKKINEERALYLSSYTQDSYIEIYENGLKAASITKIDISETAAPPEVQMTLTFDRPFLFMITDQHNLPLFMGVVDNPLQD